MSSGTLSVCMAKSTVTAGECGPMSASACGDYASNETKSVKSEGYVDHWSVCEDETAEYSGLAFGPSGLAVLCKLTAAAVDCDAVVTVDPIRGVNVEGPYSIGANPGWDSLEFDAAVDSCNAAEGDSLLDGGGISLTVCGTEAGYAP